MKGYFDDSWKSVNAIGFSVKDFDPLSLPPLKLDYLSCLLIIIFCIFSPKSNADEVLYDENYIINSINSICEYDEKKYLNLRSSLKKVFSKGRNTAKFKQYLINSVGGKISEKKVIDPLYSKTKIVSLFGYKKKCTNKTWEILFLETTEGEFILSDIYLYFDVRDISTGLIDFKFNHTRNPKKNSQPILSRLALGKFNKNEMESLLVQAGAIKSSEDKRVISYRYYIDPMSDIASRVAVWNFSLVIEFSLDNAGLVNDIKVVNK